MEVVLFNETPEHKANFIKLIKKGYYDSLLFHRVISDFMIQTGDPQSRPSATKVALGSGGPGYTLSAEINNQFIHRKGALAAARQPDNVNPDRRSNGSQFYIVQGRPYPKQYMNRFEDKRGLPYTSDQLSLYETVGGSPHIDGQYTIFGQVVKGLEIIDQIATSKTGRGDRPMQNIYIITMKLLP